MAAINRQASRMRSLILALLLAVASAFAGTREDYAANIAALVDPAKLATLRERGANPRVQKYVYWLATAQAAGWKPRVVAEAAVVGSYTNTLARKLRKDCFR